MEKKNRVCMLIIVYFCSIIPISSHKLASLICCHTVFLNHDPSWPLAKDQYVMKYSLPAHTYTVFTPHHRDHFYNILKKIIHLPTVHDRSIPVTAAGLLLMGTWFCSATWAESAFTGRSDRMGASDGTRAARSGGWSFPTGGLAYNKAQSFTISICVKESLH